MLLPRARTWKARRPRVQRTTFLRLTVDRLRASGVCAIWFCDRGFHRMAWLKRLVEMEQHFVVWLQRDVTVHLPDGAHLLKGLVVKESERRDFGFVHLRADGFVRSELTDEQKQSNRELARRRVVVEHVIRRLKISRILAER